MKIILANAGIIAGLTKKSSLLSAAWKTDPSAANNIIGEMALNILDARSWVLAEAPCASIVMISSEFIATKSVTASETTPTATRIAE